MSEQEQKFERANLSKEMKTSFLDYAMSVIVARALPDVRDGLKPVHRRILYGMNELGITPEKPYKKSARIVGDVMGKYHPHGDSAIYESMVRMAQDFSYRYPLVDGHGNFGSIDGDGAAAMRYTEARMAKITSEMLRDINKDTINFHPNYDGEEKEPDVLPARFPNLLVNGATGIAVGMTTNIPPHNLGEVIAAIRLLMDNPEVSIKELMEVMPGPDFPTGAIVIGRAGLRKAYETGQGSITVRGKVEINELDNGKEQIIISEIPYMVNKARLVERIADLAREKRIDGITYIGDESGRDGMRIVIETRRDASASVVVNHIFKQTQLQATFAYNMLAIVDGVPKTLNLKEILVHYLAHQEEVIRRRTIFEKNKAEARAHILEGLQIALDHIDEIVEILRSSQTGDAAKEIFHSRFGLSEKQSQAILDMRLVRLTGLERQKIDKELAELEEEIKRLAEILASEELRYQIIYDELIEIQERFDDERRTEIRDGEVLDIADEDLIDVEEVLITLTNKGYIKRLSDDEFRTQNRGGRGVQGMKTANDDFVETMLSCSTHDYILFFTNLGKVYTSKAYEIPEFNRTAKGIPVVNIIKLDEGEQIEAMLKLSEIPEENESYFFVTKNGTVKRTKASEFANIRRTGIRCINLVEGDELIKVIKTSGDDNVIVGSYLGYAASFNENDVRHMGRTATGVRGIRLRENDHVVGMSILYSDGDVLVVTENGYGKRTPTSEYAIKKRGGKGVLTVNITEKNGNLVGLTTVRGDEDIVVMTNHGVTIRFEAEDISQVGRASIGVRLMRLDENAKVSTIARIEPELNDDENQNDIEEIKVISDSPDTKYNQPETPLSNEEITENIHELTDQLIDESEEK